MHDNAFNKLTPQIAAYWGKRMARANRVPTPRKVLEILEGSPYNTERDSARRDRRKKLNQYESTRQ